jgi:hypothetical protein
MSDVTGPISTLPGQVRATDEGQMCDEHPDRPAYRRVQGETDSFGSEQHDLCQECYENHKREAEEARNGVCDWCKSQATDLRNRRDFEEGMSGPVYQVCGPCVKAENARLAAEFEYDD